MINQLTSAVTLLLLATSVSVRASSADEGANGLRDTTSQTQSNNIGDVASETESRRDFKAAVPEQSNAKQSDANRIKSARKQLSENVFVDVYSHCVPGAKNSRAWSFLTKGLKTFGQPEIIITVLQRPGDTDTGFVEDPLKFLAMIPELAKAGKIVGPGSQTRLGGKHFISPQFTGLVYGIPQSFKDVPMEPDTIAGIPVTAEELAVYQISGPSRILARLARLSTFFPYPTWCDRDRKSVFSADDVETIKGEPINQAASTVLFDATLLVEGKNVKLRVPPLARAKLAAVLGKLPGDVPLILSLGFDSDVNAFLVWSTKENLAVGPNGSDISKVGGSFIEFVGRQPKNEVMQVRDGYVVFLKDGDWAELKTSISAGKTFDLDLQGDKFEHLSIELLPAVYRNPIDGTALTAPGGWRTFAPSGDKKDATRDATTTNDASAPARTTRVVLLTSEDEIAKAIEVSDLAKYVKDLEKAIIDYLRDKPRGSNSYELILQSTMHKGRPPEYNMAVKPAGFDSRLISALTDVLNKVQAPESQGEFAFQLVLDVWKN